MLRTVAFLLFALTVFAKEKYNLAICALFKNEAKYLKEWIEYHRLIGVDHFYLYDNGSKDLPFAMRAVGPYLKKKVVTLTQWPDLLPLESAQEAFKWALSTQITAYENALKIKAEKETKWLIFLDVNEFLVPSGEKSLLEILEEHEDTPGIAITARAFDASQIDTLPAKKLVIESVDLTALPEKNPQITVSKVLFQPKKAVGFYWFPYTPRLKEDQAPFQIAEQELCLNTYVDRHMGYLGRKKVRKGKLNVDPRSLPKEKLDEALREGYEIEDPERPIYRFVPQVLERVKSPSRYFE
jgi:hypothetical protein